MTRPSLTSRLRPWAPGTVAAVPHNDGEVQAALDRLDELLGWLTADEDQLDDNPLPAALGPGARRAIQAISNAVRQAEADPAQPYRPDGRYQLVPLAFVQFDSAELHTVGAAVRALGAGLLPGANPLLVDVLEDFAQGQADSFGISAPGRSATNPEDLVVEAARLHGLLDLPWDDHVARLAEALPAGAGDVTLTAGLQIDYETVVDRVLRIWHHGDRLAPFLYRG